MRLPFPRFWTAARRDPQGLTHVIPLGVSCRVTHQVRVCFGTGIAWPFDWWLSPLAGLTAYLANPEPARIYDLGCIEERIEDGLVMAIRSRELGVELFHEFPRTRVQSEKATVSVVAPGWEQHVAAAREKHMQRLTRLLALNRRGNRLLFVRHKYAADPAAAAPAPEIRELWEVLRARWSAAEVDLLLVNVPLIGDLPAGMRAVTIADRPGPPPEEWQGDPEVWRAAFTAQGLFLEDARRSPGRSSGSSGPPD